MKRFGFPLLVAYASAGFAVAPIVWRVFSSGGDWQNSLAIYGSAASFLVAFVALAIALRNLRTAVGSLKAEFEKATALGQQQVSDIIRIAKTISADLQEVERRNNLYPPRDRDVKL